MKTEEIKLSQITENAGNPRTITEEKFKKLVKSLLVFPRMLSLRPIVVDSQMNVLGGNMRTRALCHIVSMTPENIKDVLDTDQRLTDSEKRLIAHYWSLWKEQPTATIVMASDLTEAQKKEFIIKDNVGFGDWDANMLANEWDTDALKDWGMEGWQLEGKNPAEEENGGGQMIILIITTRERLSLLSTSRRMGIFPSVTATIPARQILSFLQLRILRIWTSQRKHS